MSLNSFSPEKFHDFTIVDENGSIVGQIRIKPSGVLWAPRFARKWKGVSLLEFAQWIEGVGKVQSK